jgi:hypothetical protein
MCISPKTYPERFFFFVFCISFSSFSAKEGLMFEQEQKIIIIINVYVLPTKTQSTTQIVGRAFSETTILLLTVR